MYQDGIIAGVLAAVAVALWFLVFDSLRGRPLYTPSVLGTALFGRGASLVPLGATPVSGAMVLMFTWVHGLVFAVLGGIAARLLAVAERSPHVGFGILRDEVGDQLLVYVQRTFVLPAVAQVVTSGQHLPHLGPEPERVRQRTWKTMWRFAGRYPERRNAARHRACAAL